MTDETAHDGASSDDTITGVDGLLAFSRSRRAR